ncbi:Ricin B lectin [Actinobacteria bacterium OK074]|nr:Ricin B lectin [Actinobacteria bacterium OK074]
MNEGAARNSPEPAAQPREVPDEQLAAELKKSAGKRPVHAPVGELLARHWEAGYAYASLCADGPHPAGMLTTAAFTRLFEESARQGGPTAAWRPQLLVAIRHIAGEWDSDHRRTLLHPALRIGPAGGGRAAARLLPPENRRLITRAFQRLPEPARCLLWHAEVEREELDVPAALLGITLTDAAAKLERSRELLREACLDVHRELVPEEQCRRYSRLLDVSLRRGPSVLDPDLRRHMDACPHCRSAAEQLARFPERLATLLTEAVLGWGAQAYLATRLQNLRGTRRPVRESDELTRPVIVPDERQDFMSGIDGIPTQASGPDESALPHPAAADRYPDRYEAAGSHPETSGDTRPAPEGGSRRSRRAQSGRTQSAGAAAGLSRLADTAGMRHLAQGADNLRQRVGNVGGRRPAAQPLAAAETPGTRPDPAVAPPGSAPEAWAESTAVPPSAADTATLPVVDAPAADLADTAVGLEAWPPAPTVPPTAGGEAWGAPATGQEWSAAPGIPPVPAAPPTVGEESDGPDAARDSRLPVPVARSAAHRAPKAPRRGLPRRGRITLAVLTVSAVVLVPLVMWSGSGSDSGTGDQQAGEAGTGSKEPTPQPSWVGAAAAVQSGAVQGRLRNVDSGLCIGLGDKKAKAGSEAILVKCSTSVTQQWAYESDGLLRSVAAPELCLDSHLGYEVDLAKCVGESQPATKNVRYDFTLQGTLVPRWNQDLALTPASADQDADLVLKQRTDDDEAQDWEVDTDGSLRMQSVNWGKTGLAATDGTTGSTPAPTPTPSTVPKASPSPTPTKSTPKPTTQPTPTPSATSPWDDCPPYFCWWNGGSGSTSGDGGGSGGGGWGGSSGGGGR